MEYVYLVACRLHSGRGDKFKKTKLKGDWMNFHFHWHLVTVQRFLVVASHVFNPKMLIGPVTF